MLKKTMKVLLIILVTAILAGLCILLARLAGWAWWVGLTILAGILGISAAVFFFKRYYMRRREKKFVRRIVELDEAAIKTSPIHERQQLVDLQQHWKESVDLLHESYLRKKGNPLYVLPWYLIVGAPGTGKTSAINNARLSSPLTEVGRSPLPESGRKGQVPSTKNCDWWFFKEAVILDSAGRYTIPVDEAKDRDEWEKFLALLARYRRREPLNGLIISVAADDLRSAGPDKLRHDGQIVRTRVDQLMRVMGAKFPVYLLVTKMDLVYGFTQFFEALPEHKLSQAMGSINRPLNPYWREFLDAAWEQLSNRLRDLRLTFITRRRSAAGPESLTFPAEFDNLKEGLAEFVKAIFDENPYQETPLLRGLYFSSATQTEVPHSELLDFIQAAAGTEKATDREKCFFLIDFFKSILPGDRPLFRPIREFIRWRRVTNSMAVTAWLLICLCAGGLLTTSFVHNRLVIGKFKTEFERLPPWSPRIDVDLFYLDKLRYEIVNMEKANGYWFIPSLGLTESRNLEAAMKRKYVDLFFENVEKRLDPEFLKHVAGVNVDTPDRDVARYFTFAVARINTLRQYGKNGKVTPEEIFKKSTTDMIVTSFPATPPEIAALYADDYYAYLTWRGDRENSQTKLKVFLDALLDLERNTAGLKWLVEKWISNAPSVTLDKFWGEPVSRQLDEQVAVTGAYTNQGRKQIESLLAMVEQASPNKPEFAKKKTEFWNWYEQQYLKSWSAFARHFGEGKLNVGTPGAQRDIAILMTTDHNPYFRLIERISEETAWVRPEDAPPWLTTFIEFNEVQKLVKSQNKKTHQTILGRLTQEKQKVTEQLKVDVDQKSLEALNERTKIAKVWQEYLASLDKISPLAMSQEVGFRMASDFFTFPADANQQSSSIILEAYNNFLKIKSMVQTKGDLSDVWNTVSGPVDYLLDYSIRQAGSYLQQQWEGQVLGSLQGASKEKLPQLLFESSTGLVWKFLSGPAKPFIGKNRTGYVAQRASIKEGAESFIPFTGDFLAFVNSGSEGVVNYQPEYQVQMETLPITTNHDSSPDPYSNTLTLQCADGPVQLKNFNYPQKTVFRWNPDKCSDTTLSIQFPDFTLSKTYHGRMGFANMLLDFKDGSHSFTAGDFPEGGNNLARLGISSVQVSYKISGSRPVIQLLRKVPSEVPHTIVRPDGGNQRQLLASGS